MAVKAYSPHYTVVPKLPHVTTPYNNYKANTDPSAYYTQAMGFLPIDTRYMVNTTNSLAYNSMADVLLNKTAQEKRWENTPWMQGTWNPLRIAADTFLLMKDTVYDPIAQGITEDKWNGFLRGGSTALMNSLVNVGNTLDLVSNPIKGAVLEGLTYGGKNAFEGFWNGLVGDENGRKQYDYNAYIDTGDYWGSGVVDFVLSLALEIVSDPLNWISFGGKQAIASGADAAATAVTKSLKDVLGEALVQGTKNVDELVPKLMKSTKYLTDDTAKSFLQGMADESGNISKAALSQIDDIQPVLKKAITRAETSGDYLSTAKQLAESKKTRYRASFIDPQAVKLTPTSQMLTSQYLKAAAENLPDVLADNTKLIRGSKMYKGAQTIERGLRYTAGATGLDWFVGGYKAGNKIAGTVRNVVARHNPKVLKTIDDVYGHLDQAKITSAVQDLEPLVNPAVSKEFIEELNTIKGKFSALVYGVPFNKKSIAQITTQQTEFLNQINTLVNKLNLPGVQSFDAYITYLDDANVTLKSASVSDLVQQLQTIKKVLSDDLSDSAVRASYKRATDALKFEQKRFQTVTQGEQMSKLDAEFRQWNRTHGHKVTEALEKHSDDIDAALKEITAAEFVSSLKSRLIPQTLDALRNSKYQVHDDVITSFQEIWDEFKRNLNAFDENPTDVYTREAVVDSYKTLVDRLKSFTEFNTTGMTASNASQVFNKLGVPRLENSAPISRSLTPDQIDHVRVIASQEADILNRLHHTPGYTANYSNEAITSFVNSDWYKALSQAEQLEYTKSLELGRRDFILQQKNGAKWLKVLNEAEQLKTQYPMLYYGYNTASTVASNYAKVGDSQIAKIADESFSLKELSDAIEALPTYDVEHLHSIISPADIAKYKLIVYSIMNRKSSFIHLMLGLEKDGSAVLRQLESLDVRPKIADELYADTRIGGILTYFKNNNRIPTSYNRALNVGADNVEDFFVADIRRAADEFLAHSPVDATAHLQAQARTLLNMSDNEIKALADFNNVTENYSHPEAYLAKLLEAYEDADGTLYKVLNDTTIAADSIYGSTLVATKELFTRLQEYKGLVSDVSALLKSNGLEGFYTEAVLDQIMSQLSKQGRLLTANLDTVTKEIMDGVNLFIRNRFDAPSSAMDRVLWQTVADFENKVEYSEEAFAAMNRIKANLESGLAHGAVVDVDNLVDLLILSKYSDDNRIAGMFQDLVQTAKGKRIVVFDIESTGAKETAAHIYQISGKVLNADGTEVIGQNFNFIIKPPKGIKPTPLVLETLAPAGVDAAKWWDDEIVNAITTDTQLVFDNIDDALKAFTEHCNKQGSAVLAGHNIKSYDLPTLIKRAGASKAFFTNADVFDTMRYMNNRTVFQLTDDLEDLLRRELKTLFEKLRAADSAVLKNKPFSGADIRTLSDLKDMLKNSGIEGTSDFTKADKAQMKSLGFGYTDEATGKTAGVTSGYGLEDVDFAGELERNLSGIIDEWRSPSKIKGNHYYVVSKLNPDALDETTNELLNDLAQQGLVNIPLGKNIMQYFTGRVGKGNILINPVRVMSYEAANIFDFNKALDVYKVVDQDGVLRTQDMIAISTAAKQIDNLKWIPADYVEAVIDDARTLLKNIDKNNLVRCLYDNADDITTVAAAIYFYQRLAPTSVIFTKPAFEHLTHFADVSKKIADIRGRVYNPILNQIDETTKLPRFIFEGEDYFSYDQIASIIKHDSYFDSVREYNVGHNLYNAHTAAKHAMYEPIIQNAKAVDAHLKSLGSGREAAERGLRNYNNALDMEAVNEILNRPNRVTALQAEAYARGGYVCFETGSAIDLDDFRAAGFVVVDNVVNNNGNYIQIICATREMFTAAQDIELGLKTIRGVDGIDDTLFHLIKESRELAANNGIKNIGYSHGDLLVEDTIRTLQEALSRAGVPEDTIRTLVSAEDLIAEGFFDTLRANNSVIGGKSVWQFITNDANAVCITDPFKQIAFSTRSGITAARETVTVFSNLILNKHSDINTAAIYETLSDEDLYKALKANPDMCMVYITKTGYWDNTKSGIMVKEFDLVNAASIKRARAMGGVHIIPRTQAAQVMQAVNEFKLPPIARIAKGVSDVYKVAYLGSLGFLVRNIIDSNFKTYASLDGMVSLPRSIQHFFQSLGYIRKHTNLGQEYTRAMGKYFNNDLEYEVFYKFCNAFGDDIALEDIVASYSEKLQGRVANQIGELSEKITEDVVKSVKPNLIAPEFFTVIDSFIQHGPSAGLSKSILQEIPSASKGFDEVGLLEGWNKLITEKTPAKYVYGANDYIEQAARLSMFLQRLELGDTIDDANKAIIKAHFDYADKSIGMLYTEILFPFMSFSYKNLNFWVETMYKNPMLVGQMENIFRTIFDYQGLFEPDQGAYELYDYTFDWSKDVNSFESNMPWTYVNASRLYHLLNGNIVIDTGKDVKHDAGYGAKNNDLYRVFKLSPSVLDATKMLFNPLNTYSERLLPPAEAAANALINMANGKAPTDQMDITTLTNMLPYIDIITQRVGLNSTGLRHNNIFTRAKDVGPEQLLLSSLFGAAYVPQKDHHYYYDSDYNILGGFKTNYYAKRYYANPYNSKYPSYTLTRMAQHNRPRNIYSASKTSRMNAQQYNSYKYYTRNVADRIVSDRIKDYYYYY